ncbi:MAG: phosphate ABC transporter permease subunit PstC [Frankiaceae bacterium]|nr:phosphate ABC transporter permease subunit PstC [Frankiaceae bacterium]MBV9869730.1 phosphate ABC transporter permease subunit PstC [Frankiaceae bacterium]
MASITTADTASLRSSSRSARGDAVFRTLTFIAGAFVFVLLGAIALFLVIKAMPAIKNDPTNFFTTTQWSSSAYGIAATLFGTALTAVLALAIAVPVGVGVALYITQYAPRRIATLLGYVTDMLAAVPSVVYGLWGLIFLLPRMVGIDHFLAKYFGWTGLFHDPAGGLNTFPKTIFSASIVLSIMVLPIIAAISREVFRQVDPVQKEAALALGATRWEMIRTAVLPPSRAGVISATMLGLGRALGETIAVALVIGNVNRVSGHVLVPGGNTIAANIANTFGEAADKGPLIASGLVLFVLTLVVNLAARYVILRAGTEERSAV